MEINLDEIIRQLARLHARRMELANILSEWIRNPGKGSLGSSNPKNVLPVHFRGLVWKRVWKITFFGLQQGQDLENRAAHPHQEFPGSIPRALFLSYIGRGVPPSLRRGRARFSRHFFATLALCTAQLTGDFKPLTQCFMLLKAGNQTQGATHTRTFKRNRHVCAVLDIHSLSIQIRSIQVLFLLFSNTRLKPLENICQERGRKPTRKAYLRPSISARSLKNQQRTC